MALEILKITKIDVCLLGTLIVNLAYQVRKSQFFELKRLDFGFMTEVKRTGRINPATPFHPRTEVTGFSGYSL